MDALTVFLLDTPDYLQQVITSLESEKFKIHAYSNENRLLSDITQLNHPKRGACIVADIDIPAHGGLAFMDKLLDIKCQYPLIMTGKKPSVSAVIEIMRKGANHFLEKPFLNEALTLAIKQATKSPMAGLKNPGRSYSLLCQLSPREHQVLNMICSGKLNKTIADILGISVKTVELHRSNVTSKLGARNIQDLMKLSLGYAH